MRQFDDVVEDSEPEREQRRRRTDTTDVDADDGLSRFAYKPSLSSSRAPSSADTAPARPARVVTKDPADPQIAQLSKCVACGLRWTSRKTAKQKLTHIEQCSKKNALTKDTIRILIEKEIAILSPAQTIAPSCIPANDPSENAVGTLMDSVVPMGPAQKNKRHQVILTVKSPSETRESILHKARDTLGPTDALAEPQLTQQFGQSALAHRSTLQPQRPALLAVNRSMEESLPTQPFGISSLRGRLMTSEQSIDGSEQQPGASMFAQDSVLSSDCHKRPASPPPLVGGASRTVKRRLL